MTHLRPSLFSRDDTFLGVCEGLGQDFGVDPLWFRVAFALAMFVQPLWVPAAYLSLGAVVLASRWLFPDVPAVSPVAEEAAPAMLRGDNDGDAPALPRAA